MSVLFLLICNVALVDFFLKVEACGMRRESTRLFSARELKLHKQNSEHQQVTSRSIPRFHSNYDLGQFLRKYVAWALKRF
jgi:hypothetical protein